MFSVRNKKIRWKIIQSITKLFWQFLISYFLFACMKHFNLFSLLLLRLSTWKFGKLKSLMIWTHQLQLLFKGWLCWKLSPKSLNLCQMESYPNYSLRTSAKFNSFFSSSLLHSTPKIILIFFVQNRKPTCNFKGFVIEIRYFKFSFWFGFFPKIIQLAKPHSWKQEQWTKNCTRFCKIFRNSHGKVLF